MFYNTFTEYFIDENYHLHQKAKAKAKQEAKTLRKKQEVPQKDLKAIGPIVEIPPEVIQLVPKTNLERLQQNVHLDITDKVLFFNKERLDHKTVIDGFVKSHIDSYFQFLETNLFFLYPGTEDSANITTTVFTIN
jgi:hypothetical protein